MVVFLALSAAASSECQEEEVECMQAESGKRRAMGHATTGVVYKPFGNKAFEQNLHSLVQRLSEVSSGSDMSAPGTSV